ncbi:hypothetical protein JXA34_03330 [Patescibacteria group bacterium]|nr:hypothetical protein [Patescibacteria group bacterium]
MTADVLDKSFKFLRRNYGCPGLDGISLKKMKRDYIKHKNIVSRKYIEDQINVLPIKTTTIIDYTGRDRDIFVYCIHERWLQMYLKLQIKQNVERTLEDYVFGYRKGMTMGNLNDYLRSIGSKYVVHLDIVRYFDHIDREILFNYLVSTVGVDGDILVKIRKSVSHTNKGLPQGNVLSPILSNVYLTPFDRFFPKRYARFSDDLYFALDTLEEKDGLIEKADAQLRKLNLKINYTKLEVKNANEF